MPNTNQTGRHDLPGDADRLSYHPNLPSDWSDPDPRTVQQGLDDLAAAATAAASHNHNASDINAGLLALARGGANADVSAFTASELVRLNAAGTALESAGKTIADLHADIGARVYNSANISIATSTWTTLTFDSEHYDTDGIHSTSTNTSRLTAKTAGRYYIWYGGFWDYNSAGGRVFELLVNGATGIAKENNRGDTHIFIVSTIYDLAVGDYVEIRVFQDSGVSNNMHRVADFALEFGMQLIAKTL